MLCNAFLWNFRHPRKYLPKSTKVYLAQDGVTEITGPGYKDTRNFWATLFDPFDLVGLIRGRDNETRFWDENQENTGHRVVETKRDGGAGVSAPVSASAPVPVGREENV